MPRLDITNPKVIDFYIEKCEKSRKLRLQWFLKNRGAVEKAAAFSGEPKCYKGTDVMEHRMIENIPSLRRDFELYKVNHRKKTPIDMKMPAKMMEVKPYSVKLPELETKSAELTNMRAVNEEVSKLLYKPTPKYGREKYLKERSKIALEKKYCLPLCESWLYGWRLTDSKLSQNKPERGMHCALTRELQTRGAYGPDPPHYQEIPLKTIAIKCRRDLG